MITPRMSVAEIFQAQREWCTKYVRTVLEAAEPITADNVLLAELLIMEAEVDAARRALREAGPPAWQPPEETFVRQVGTRCMSTSLANGMISLGETCFGEGREREGRVEEFTEDVVRNTSAFGKPGEYRSVDDLFKYLEGGRLSQVQPGGAAFGQEYRVRLTCSLLDVVEGLWTGKARLVIQRRAHAYLAFGLEVDARGERVLFRDPMHGTGPGCDRISLETLRRDYLWSPLKKIPRLMGPHAFKKLSAEQLLGHLARYDEMENLGVDCPSALVYRQADAPPLNAPPPAEEEPQPEPQPQPSQAAAPSDGAPEGAPEGAADGAPAGGGAGPGPGS